MHKQRLNTDSHRQPPIRSIIAFAIILLAALPLAAQAPVAPLPAQLTSAKTVFLANAGSSAGSADYNQLAIIAYNSSYQALVAENNYHLTLTPTDADLIFEISVIGDGRLFTGRTRLVVRDVKSQSLLWTISEDIKASSREKEFQKNAAISAAKLVSDLNTLITVAPVSVPAAKVSAPTAPTINASSIPKKTRLSDEK
jgi:hypothetical protein